MKKLLLASALIMNVALAHDPLFPQQWGLKNDGQSAFRTQGDLTRETIKGIPGIDINWPGQDQLSKLGPNREVIVAVIDTGMDMEHPEFKNRLYKGKDFLDDADMSDEMGHGTHVAGIIAANADGVGVEGITPSQVKILPLKVLKKELNDFFYKQNGKTVLLTDIFANAIAYAVEAKAQVINMSLGWPQIMNTPRVMRALDIAQERGVIVVAASGNNNKDVPTWPCAHPAVICVGAIDGQGSLTEFTNHGGKVDLVAPGEWIISTITRKVESYGLRINGYDAKNGSSQAAPFVSAAAALLKLQNPDITVEEVKLRLYGTAKKINADKEGRFVRFGALDLNAALTTKPQAMASVLVKNLTTVGVDQNGNFNFNLPLEILGETQDSPEVTLNGLDANVKVESDKVFISGTLDDITRDSEIKVSFTVSLGSKRTQTNATLSFARDISLQDMTSVKIPGIPAQALMAIQGGIRTPKIFPVIVDDEQTSDSHFYVAARLGTKDLRVATFRANIHSSLIEKTSVTLPDTYELFSVYEKDVNMDGQNDLIFYGLDGKRENAVLTFTNMKGEPLFGKRSRWEYNLDDFGLLPNKGEPPFSWISLKTDLGLILVPYFSYQGPMPDLDNSNNMLEHESPNKLTRYYYLEPYLDGDKSMVRTRVVDSVAMKKQLKKKILQNPNEVMQIERLLPQSSAERKKGINRHLVSVGEGFNLRFYILTVSTPGSFTITPYGSGDAFMSNNNVVSSRSLDDNKLTQNAYLMALFNRNTARVKPLSNDGLAEVWNLKTNSWSNQFQDVVGSFEGRDRKTFFIESRYHVYVYDQKNNGKPLIYKLPVNRDSSMQQVQFSETLQTVIVSQHGEHQPAVAINSIQIYGDRFYSMVADGETFKRPIALSVIIPANCVPFRSQMVKSLNHSAYTMLCSQPDGGASLSFFPLELP
jgi:hypothetical protein